MKLPPSYLRSIYSVRFKWLGDNYLYTLPAADFPLFEHLRLRVVDTELCQAVEGPDYPLRANNLDQDFYQFGSAEISCMDLPQISVRGEVVWDNVWRMMKYDMPNLVTLEVRLWGIFGWPKRQKDVPALIDPLKGKRRKFWTLKLPWTIRMEGEMVCQILVEQDLSEAGELGLKLQGLSL